jgi:hypothetical protein
MAVQLPPEVMQNAANTTAPGVQPTQQAQPKNLANGRKQPNAAKKTAAQKVYPKLATQDQNGGDGD